MHVWLNGEFVSREEARVSVFDAGFQHGVGLFETMFARNARVFRVESHLKRLAASARDLLLSDNLRTEPLAEAIERTVQKNNLDRARVRLTITGGDLNMLHSIGKSRIDPTILIVAQPPPEYPKEFFENGVTVMIADARDNPLHPMAGHKTLNYWPRIRALQQAAVTKASEAIWFTISNHLASGSVSNIFLVKDGVLLTPIARGQEQHGAIPSSVLPGITRSAIFEIAESMNMEVHKQMLDIEALLSADEVFLTNSSWGVLPVVGVEKERIAGGGTGEITQRLRDLLLNLIERETNAA